MRPSVFTSPQRGFKKISIFAFMQLAAQSHSLPPPLSRPQILFIGNVMAYFYSIYIYLFQMIVVNFIINFLLIFIFCPNAATRASMPSISSVIVELKIMLLIDLANLTNKLTLTERVKNSNQNFHRSFWILFNSNKTNIWLPPCCPGTEGQKFQYSSP